MGELRRRRPRGCRGGGGGSFSALDARARVAPAAGLPLRAAEPAQGRRPSAEGQRAHGLREERERRGHAAEVPDETREDLG